MIVNKEFYEVLNMCKDLIKSNEYDFNNFTFTKENLQKILIANPQIKKLIDIIKEKSKKKCKLNNNFFHIINNTNKKSYKDLKIIISSLTSFSLTYNEPKYIEDLNSRIYDRIRYLILDETQKSSSCLIQISNGKTSEFGLEKYEKSDKSDKSDKTDKSTDKTDKNTDKNTSEKGEKTEKSEKPQAIVILPNAELFLNEIYKTKNENLILNGDELYSFKLKKHSLYSLKTKFETIIANNAESVPDMVTMRKIEHIDNLISSRNITELLTVLEKGIPNSVRKKVYMYLLEINGDNSLNSNNKNNDTFNEIYDNLMTTDFMILEDSEDILKNEHYFLFNDIIKKILFRFYRDATVFTEVQVLYIFNFIEY